MLAQREVEETEIALVNRENYMVFPALAAGGDFGLG